MFNVISKGCFVLFFVLNLYACASRHEGEVGRCERVISDVEIIKKISFIYGIDDDLKEKLKFDISYEKCNYHVKMVAEPAIPGGDSKIILDYSGEVIALIPGR